MSNLNRPFGRSSWRSARRYTQYLRDFPYRIPADTPLVRAPEYRALVHDNSSQSISSDERFNSREQSSIDFQFSEYPESVNSSNNSESVGNESISIPEDFDFQKEFVKVIIQNSISYAAAEQLIEIINSEFGYKRLPKSMKTLLRQIKNEVYSLNYKILCDCRSIVSFKSKDGYIDSDISCNGCQKRFNGYNDLKRYSFYCTLQIKEQIQAISQSFPQPPGYSASDSSSLQLKIILAADAIPIFKAVDSSLHVLVIFIDGMKKCGKDAIPILSTLYYGRGKPDVDVFFSAFLTEYTSLSVNGFATNWHACTKLSIRCIVADAPCRAWILGMMQFNSHYGCHKCYAQLNGGKYKMLLSNELSKRTLEETENFRRCQGDNEEKKGVNKYTPLSLLNDFDYIKYTLVEYIHCVILGVVKNLIKNIYLESSWGVRVFTNSTRPALKYFEEKFQSIEVPSSIKRFRNFNELTNYKSSEYENLLYYYAYPLFKEKLKPEFMLHVVLLASAFSKLLRVSDNTHTIDAARNEIDTFLMLIERLNYPDSIKRYNTHSLVHLPDDVKNVGNLNNYNAYGYENFLGYLKKLVKSPNNISQQIIFQLKVSQIAHTQEINLQLKKAAKVSQLILDQHRQLGIPTTDSSYYLKCITMKYTFKAFNERASTKKVDHNILVDRKMYRIEYFVEFGSRAFITCFEYKVLSPLKFDSMGIQCILDYAFFVKLDSRRQLVPINEKIRPLILAKTSHNTLLFHIITKNN